MKKITYSGLILILIIINTAAFAAGGGGGGLPGGATSLSCGGVTTINLDASGYSGSNPTSGDAGCNPCCYAGADLDGDGLQDVPFSVENAEFFQYCNTSGAPVTVDMVADETGTGSSCNIQGAVWVGASLDAATLDCGNSEYSFFDSNPGGAADGFTFSSVTIPAGQCAFMMVDGYGGATCSSVAVSVVCPCTPPAAPTATATPNPVCSGSNVTLNASTISGATYTWTGPGGFSASTQNTSVTGITTTGTYSVTATVGGCVGPAGTVTVTVNPLPTVNAESNISVCAGATVPLNSYTSTPAGATFTWTNNNTSIGLGASGSGSTPSFTATNSTGSVITATITVTPTLAGCVGTPITYTITVNPFPTVVAEPNLSFCAGASAPANTFVSSPAGATFTWTNSNTAIGLAASGSGGTPSFTATNTTSAAISGTVTITPSLGGCVGTPSTYTITVNPSPTVVAESNVSVCAGATVPANTFTSTPAGATFTWTNSNTAIGLAASGSTSTPSFTATNATGSAISGTITITPTLAGCVGPVSTYTITVNPIPTVVAEPDIAFCAGSTVPSNTFVSSPAGAAFTWTNSNTAIGLAASGSGSTPSFTATNATGSAITGTVTVTPTLGGCAGTPDSYIITINPAPTVVAESDISVCAGASVPANTFVSSPAGATFTWTNSNTAIGLAASGSTSTPSFTATNATGSAISGTLTITPTLAGCAGTPEIYTITVNPIPTVVAEPDLTFCPGDAVPLNTFVSSPAGATFSWTNSNTAIGLAASGSGSTPAFTAANATGASISGTIIITPTLAGCAGTPESYTITVNPSPTVVAESNVSVCAGATVPANTFVSSPAGATFTWTNSNTAIGLAASGGTSTPSFTSTNATGSAISGTITITPTLSGCAGTPGTYTITVNPADDASFSYSSSTYCQTAANPTPVITGLAGGVFSSTAGLVLNASTGTITLASSTLGTYTVTYTTTGPCPNTSTFNVTITTAPSASFSYSGPYCQFSANPSPTFPAGSSAGTFSSTPGLVFVSAGTGQIDLTASTPGTYTVTNTIAAAGGCPPASSNASVTISPFQPATFSYTGSPYCSNAANPSPVFSGGGIAGTFSSSAGLVFVSTATGEVNLSASTPGTYTVTNTVPAAGGCPPETATASITITPLPVATFSYTGTPYCQNATNPLPTFSGGGVAGTFSSTAGLSLNSSTGEVDLLASTPGTYTVTNTIPAAGGCPIVTATSGITITPMPAATFSYTSSPYCQNAANPSPTFSGGGVAGTFSSTAGLVFVSTSTGQINLSASTAGTYTVTNTIAAAGGCPAVAETASITITPLPVATFSYTGTPYCQNAANPLPTFSGGGVAGSFSAAAGLFVNTATGEVDLAASTPGTYTVTNTIPAASGCPVVTATASITITPAPVGTFSYTASPYCQNASDPLPTFSGGGTAGTFSAAAGLVFVSTSTGQVDLSASTAGTYTVTNTIPASGGCPSVIETASITITPLPVATFSYTGTPYCQTAANPSPTFSGGGVAGTFSSTPGLSVNSSTGQVDLMASTPGTYTVTNTIPAASGCPIVTATSVITITPVQAGTFSYTASPYCQDAADPSPTFSGGGVAGTFSSTAGLVFISTSSGQVDLSASTAGTYTVTNTISAAGGCPAVAETASITITPLPVATFSYTGTPYCENMTNPSPVFSGGGIAGTFSSTAGLVFVSSATGEVDLLASTPGTYTVTNTIAAAGGCPAVIATSGITITEMDDATFTYPTSTFCQTGTDPIPTITGLLGGTFSSTAGITLNASTGEVTLSSSTLGTYLVTYNTAGPCPSSSTFSITITNAPSAAFSYSGPYCQGASPNPLPVFGAGASGGTFSATGLFIIASTGEVDLTASTPGTYTVINSIAASGGCAASADSASITINPAATADAGLDDAICSGSIYTLAGSAGGGASGLTWSSPGGGTFSDATLGTSTYTPSASDIASGSVTLTITTDDPAGACPSVTDDMVLTIDPAALADAGADASVCAGGNYTLSGSISGSATTLTWSSPAGGSFSDATSATSSYTPSAADISAGSVILTITTNDPAGACGAASDVMTLTITPADDASFSYSSGTFCATGTDPLPVISGTTGGTFSAAAGLVLDPSTGEISLSASTLGTYTVIYSTSGACPATDSTIVTISTSPSAAFSYAGPYCQSSGVNPLPVFGMGSSAGVFSSAAGLSLNTASGEIDLSLSTAGTYTVYNNIAASGGCAAATDSTTVTIDAGATADAGLNATICEGNTYTLSGTIGGSATGLTWSSATGGTFSSTTLATATYTPSALDISTGTATITITTDDPSGACAAATDNMLLTINPLPNADGGAMQTLSCGTSSAILNGSTTTAGATINWTGPGVVSGGTTTTPTVNTAGTYTITVTLAGCSSSDTVSVISNINAPDVNAGAVQTIDCNNITVALTGSSVTAGVNYSWSGPGVVSGGSSSAATVNAAGVYTLTVTDPSNGCTSTDTVTVLSNTLAPLANAGSIQSIGCGSASATLDGSGSSSGANITYSWSTISGNIVSGGSTSTPNVDAGGIYTITVTNTSNGCSSTDTVSVLVLPNPIASFTASPANGVAPLSVDFSNTSLNSNTYFWDLGNTNSSTATNPSELYTLPGTYTVILIASDNNLCPDTTSFDITVYENSAIVAPNVFTPNGDNSNDFFSFTTVGIAEMNVEIYDRWGLKLAQMDGPTGSWDGRTSSGQATPDGTYYYILKAKGFDSKEYEMTGFISLVR